MKRERGALREGQEVIAAVGVTGSRMQTEKRMRTCIDIPHKTVSSHLKGSLTPHSSVHLDFLPSLAEILRLAPAGKHCTTMELSWSV